MDDEKYGLKDNGDQPSSAGRMIRLAKQIEKYPQQIKGPNIQEFEDSILNCYSYQKRGNKLSNRKTVGKR